MPRVGMALNLTPNFSFKHGWQQSRNVRTDRLVMPLNLGTNGREKGIDAAWYLFPGSHFRGILS
jgi:hypothetical protein